MYKILFFPTIVLVSILVSNLDCRAKSTSLSFHGAAQVEITTESGRRVLIDVISPVELSAPPGKEDILLTTHNHPDHWNRAFQADFPGRQLMAEKGRIDLDDVTVLGMRSIHHPDDDISATHPTNTIFLVETGGVRIAHLGDIGQVELTREQLKLLGRVDVLITQFDNERSLMTIENLKGFHLTQQVAPRLVIPTHHAGIAALTKAQDYFPCLARESGPVELSFASLPQNTHFLVLGNLASIALEDFSCTSWPEERP
jgi:L-ascorbate metabolism protein UlaG (beta-lactamase superfamily)